MPGVCGVLRGHTFDCVHGISKGHASISDLESTGWRNFDTNPHVAGMAHSVTLALSMDQVREYILEPLANLPPKRPSPMPRISRYTSAYVACLRSKLARFCGNDISFTIAYIWQYCRSGIFVSIRNSRLCLFVPFCNPEYSNTWSPHVRSTLPDSPLPPCHWWSNGWMLCEMQPDNVWGDAWVTTIRDMLESSCMTGEMGDCDFILNKRDTPCVRLDGKDPMNPFDALPRIVNPCALSPVLSFNSGQAYADICCPLGADWHRATGKTFAQKNPLPPYRPASDVYWEHKDRVAVWRGSMTGAGIDAQTNQRAYLCSLRSPLLDCKLTGANRRWKVCPISRAISRASMRTDASRKHFMTMEEQQSTFRYGICIDGHGAADRTGELLNGRQCILKVESNPNTLGHRMWLDDLFFAWEHFVPVKSDLSDLLRQIAWLNKEDSRAEKIACNCKAAHEQCLSIAGIIEWWVIMTNLMK